MAPNARPWKVRPSSSTRSAGGDDSTTETSGRASGCTHDRPFVPQGPDVEAYMPQQRLSANLLATGTARQEVKAEVGPL
jgi:hypothetical protein